MKVLFVFDDGDRSSFFVYDLGRQQSLWRVAPEIKLRGVSLGELYLNSPITTFLQYFSVAFGIEITKYFVLAKAEGLAAIKASGLDPDGKLTVTVTKSFTALKNGQRFHQGEQRLTLPEIDAYISYQIDEDGRWDVFTRQEDLIRLMKWKTVKPSLTTITQNFGTVKEHANSNLGLRDMLKLGSGYLSKGNAQMAKQTIPTAGSYTLAGDFPFTLQQVDWTRNPIALAAELR